MLPFFRMRQEHIKRTAPRRSRTLARSVRRVIACQTRGSAHPRLSGGPVEKRIRSPIGQSRAVRDSQNWFCLFRKTVTKLLCDAHTTLIHVQNRLPSTLGVPLRACPTTCADKNFTVRIKYNRRTEADGKGWVCVVLASRVCTHAC